MKNYIYLILLSLFIFLSKFSYSQANSFGFTAGYGIHKLMAEIKSKPGGSGGMGFYYSPINALDAGFSFNVGNFEGEDGSYVYNTNTGVKFLTNFYDYSIRVKYDLYSLIAPNPFNKFGFYFSVGAGYIEFRDRLEDTKGNFLEGFGYDNAGIAKRKTTTELFVPIGLGVKYRIDKNYSFSFEPTYTWCNTFKLDYVEKNNKKDYYFYFPLIFEYRIYTNTTIK